MPNLLLLCFDQLPTWLLGFMGNSQVETPAFDLLASKSLVFDRAYTTNPDISFPEILGSKLQSLECNIQTVDQAESEDSLSNFVEQLIEALNSSSSNSNQLIIANAKGMSDSILCRKETEIDECYQEDNSITQIENEPPEFLFIESLDEHFEDLFDAFHYSLKNWSLIIAASKGFPKKYGGSFDEKHDERAQLLSHANVNIPVIVYENGQHHSARDHRHISIEDIARTFGHSIEKNLPLTQSIEDLSVRKNNHSLISKNSHGDISWRSEDHCLVLSSRYFQKLISKEVDFFETASELEIEEFTCEAKLYLKPEDYWEHNNVSKQFPETTQQILKEILEFAHQPQRN